jgi:putative DNA methylase
MSALMATKKELLAQEVAKAVGAGKAVAMETVKRYVEQS